MAVLTDWPWQHWARRRPHQTAFISGDERLSWLQLARKIAMLANGFQRQGVRAGSGVMLRGGNGESVVLAYLALLQCGARLLPVNPQLPHSQRAKLLPGLNIDFSLMFEDATDAALRPLTMIEADGVVKRAWQEEDIATLTLTSGSSGQPKAVAHTFNAHLASAAGVVSRLNFSPHDVWLLSLPVHHVSGQGIVWRWLLTGACLALQGDKPLHEALAVCSFASLVPTQLWRLLQRPSLPEGLRTVLLGGSAIPDALTEQAEASGIACWCGYGMTETASTVTAKRTDGRSGVGQALAGHRIRLVDGEIHLQSAALGCGYWRNGELLPLTAADGWFSTRDGGRLVEGELQLTGRLDNLFFSAGEGIQPEQIEQILLTHPDISQAFIVPVADEEFGHRPVALVAVSENTDLTTLAEWAKPRLAGFQRPVQWYPLPELSDGGIKIPRRRLTLWVAEQQHGRR